MALGFFMVLPAFFLAVIFFLAIFVGATVDRSGADIDVAVAKAADRTEVMPTSAIAKPVTAEMIRAEETNFITNIQFV
jgi:hypothetical protein